MNRYARRIEELTELDPCIIEINQQQHSVSEAELQRIESVLGVDLPSDYREFMRDYGGFWLADNRGRLAAVYHLGDSVGKVGISFFYEANGEGYHRIDYCRSSRDGIPFEVLPIAESGNVGYYLAIEGQWKGTVYQWYPPGSFFERLYYHTDLEIISRSFDAFIKGLHSIPEDYNSPTQEELDEVAALRSQLEKIEIPSSNRYSSVMRALNARYVYSPIGEEAPVVSEQDLLTLEAEFGASLPEDYRELLRDFGGYSFLPQQRSDGFYCLFPYINYVQSNTLSQLPRFQLIKYFHGHLRNDLHSLVDHYHRLKDVLPSGVIPIADGGAICVSLAGDDVGTVYLAPEKVRSSREEDPESRVERSALIPLASSFDEFIRSLEIKAN